MPGLTSSSSAVSHVDSDPAPFPGGLSAITVQFIDVSAGPDDGVLTCGQNASADRAILTFLWSAA